MASSRPVSFQAVFTFCFPFGCARGAGEYGCRVGTFSFADFRQEIPGYFGSYGVDTE